eukprot:scaffold23069_cov79-Attheya_sp.AAC.2
MGQKVNAARRAAEGEAGAVAPDLSSSIDEHDTTSRCLLPGLSTRGARGEPGCRGEPPISTRARPYSTMFDTPCGC